VVLIAVAGHVCLDITPSLPQVPGGRFAFAPGALLEAGKCTFSPGGAVANTGMALSKLGADVMLMGKIGRDALGNMLRELLAAGGAGDSMIPSGDAGTSYSVVLAPPGEDRMFLHYSGVNDTFCADDLDYDKIAQARLFHFGYPPLMRGFYRDNGQELARMFRRVKETGALTSLDMALMGEKSDAARADWPAIIRAVLPYTDFFVPSAEELCMMLQPALYREWQRRAQGRDASSALSIAGDVEPLADMLMEMGAKIVLVKCGVSGLLLRSAEQSALSAIGQQLPGFSSLDIIQPCYKPPRVLSATGAGDTCIAAFLLSALSGYPPADCLRFAAATGALCVSSYDTVSALEPFESLQARIDAVWETLPSG
jgi:sugar/nucleoside kinase (ribokinase family)